MIVHVKTKYLDQDVRISMLRYAGNNAHAILLHDPVSGAILTTATTNLFDYPVPEGFAFIKDYSENEGMLQCLVDLNLVELTEIVKKHGFTQSQLVKLSPELIELAKQEQVV